MRINSRLMKEARSLEVNVYVDGRQVRADEVVVEISGPRMALPDELIEYVRQGISTPEYADVVLDNFAQKFNTFMILEAITVTENMNRGK